MGVGVGAGVARGEDPRLWVSLSLGQALGAFDPGSKPGISGPGCELRPRSLASVHQLPFHQLGHWKSSSAFFKVLALKKNACGVVTSSGKGGQVITGVTLDSQQRVHVGGSRKKFPSCQALRFPV